MYLRFFKRFFDFGISLITLLVFFPLLLALTLIGAIVMKGNPFFVQLRPGMIDKKTGKERLFHLIKFRTMSNEKNEEGDLLPDKERLCKYGRFLRKTSLDELPELWNIIRGDMSIIGPRPWLVKYLDYYSSFDRQRQLVRPGLTGLSQVSGRNNATWKKRFELDAEYVEKISFKLDVKILFLTVKKVFAHEGIDFAEGHQSIMDYFKSERESETSIK